MKKFLTFTFIAFLLCIIANAKDFKIKSPSGKLEITISINDEISYTVYLNGKVILAPSILSMKIENGIAWGIKPSLIKNLSGSKSETLVPVVPRKFSKIESSYNYIRLLFKGNYQLEFRAFDEGVAYRWETDLKNEFKVVSEEVNFNFEEGHSIYFPQEESMYSHQEREYPNLKIKDIQAGLFCSTGALVNLLSGTKVFISESDLLSYPGLWLEKSSTNLNGFKGKFAGYPEKTETTSDRDVKITKYADYLAIVKGQRTFPWRLMIIAENDADLLTSELVYKLASPSKITDVSWIKPGKVAWDWWNANNIYGVDFKAGINNNTYKYYIDFASKYGLDYIILDEGWYDLKDVMKQEKDIDVKELVDYGKVKNVGIILWVTWKALDDKLDEALKQYEAWGVKGIKVDFMQRDDQWMVDYYEKISNKGAEHKMLVDFHGAYKPTGLNITYPNVITSEGVKGLENSKWSDKITPEHNVTLPFIRMVAGPMDYTPGAMINATKMNFKAVFTEPMSATTRCQQLAMYVIYESPLQMLSDNPSNYYREPVCMEFLSAVPVVWEDTKVLHAKVADYVVMARKNGKNWYIGGMTDLTNRDVEIDFGFLPAGKYRLNLWQDGINASRHAGDFKKVTQNITEKSKITIHMASGGGFAGVLVPVQ